MIDDDNDWTSSEYASSGQDAILDAHFAAGATYDFFNENFGRDSYDDNGATIYSYANMDLGVYGYSSSDNAFWTGYVMVYGEGTSYEPLTTVDVTGHEIGHAYTEYTADLVYQKEPGAMNESLSDIWGTCVENYVNENYGLDKDLWLLASEIGSAFRSMSNPNAYSQPDTRGGSYWVSVTSCSPSSSNDYCGVHTNSGVGNHWFYILTEGKSGTNDNGDTYSVTGIGIDKAAEITWISESSYMSSQSDYDDWRTYSIQVAEDTYGEGSDEVIAVTNAWYAVGVGDEYDGDDDGGGDDGGTDECVSSPLTLDITFDNYPEETSWEITDDSGATVASGGTYGSQSDGSSISVDIDLDAGDYTFTISDEYGDGICCSYGDGSYTLSSGSVTIASGGNYGSSESTDFCIEGDSGATDDTEAPTAPTGLTASSVTTSSVSLSWTASSDNIGVTKYEVYYGSSLATTTTSTSATVSSLSAGTTYAFIVVALDAAGNESSASSAVNVTTDSEDEEVSYCTASGNNVSYEWIDYVGLGSIDNSSSADGGYGDYTSLSTTLGLGSSYTIEFSAGFASSSYSENWSVFIDYNHDGDFTDSGEEVVTGSSSDGSTYSGSFSVPSSATAGGTTMRVVMTYNADPSACGTFSYGEVEDYTVVISSSSLNAFSTTATSVDNPLDNELSTTAFSIFPNPVQGEMTLNLSDIKTVTGVKIYDMKGKTLKTIETLKTETIDVSNLESGLYILEVMSERGTFDTKFMKE